MNEEVIFSRLEVTSPWSVFVSLVCRAMHVQPPSSVCAKTFNV